MSRRDRHDRRPDDKFLDITYSFVDYLMQHRTTATVILLIAVGVVLGVLAYRSHLNAYNENALALLEGAKSADDFKNVAEAYPGSAAGPVALFYCGRKLIDERKYDQAQAVFSSLVRLHPSHSLASNALALSGMILEQQKKFEEAVTSYQALIDRYPQSFITPRILLNMGTCLEKLGKLTEAKGAYEKVVSAYPASAWKEEAVMRLSNLGTEAPKGS